ncbi:hypothetical protein M0813_02330 [Anaeramoeba flamelloides]|uniref:4-nitrophenylphosphatase n=1 Tax=Anaeramoeba flamelloides TaxID=1746091 RepID=A0ABQ8YIE5_9EUKA|nr:hypothetical protein M0813_02330 [Anaeramoeba flamelloides]
MKTLLTKKSFPKWINSFDTYIFDCDGVLYASGKSLPGAKKLLHLLKRKKKQTYFLTNNSTKSFPIFQSTLKKFEFPAIEKKQLVTPFTSFLSVLDNLETFDKSKNKVFAIVPPVIDSELKKNGINVLSAEHHTNPFKIFEGESFQLDQNVGAILVSNDMDFSWSKAAIAGLYLNKYPNLPFYKTNPEPSCPINNYRLPSTGSIARMIEVATGREAQNVGKPEMYGFSFITKHLQANNKEVNKNRICMLGDRIITDMKFAENSGISSCWVGTGVSSMAEALNSTIKIDYIIKNFEELL